MKKSKYVSITYPKFLSWAIWRELVLRLWKRFLCTKNIHLFDEMESLEHLLHCDACELMVHIALIETIEEACARADKLLYIKTTAIEKRE